MKEGRLAIVGAGSSGLVTLKNALDRLPGWDIICYEKGDDAIGCWGNPYPGFVSTSTKFTTQFTSHRKWDCRVDPADRESREDFFKGDEYGRYLTGFSEEHGLARHIRKNATVEMIEKDVKGWRLWIDGEAEVFDRLIICTGLAEKPKVIDSPVPSLRSLDEPPHQQTIVVIGGGESAADIAHRLAEPSLGNRVYLSLKSGIRVSPRYHPIRGVPSDFLRNRLMLSIHQRLRNAIGQKFVEARIRHREKFERFFGSRAESSDVSASVTAKRKSWDAKLTAGAKDQLFSVFHTKSDDFLDDVAADRITIIGPPCDDGYRSFRGFDDSSVHTIEADAIYPMIGYSSGLSEISDGEVLIRDFHLGCLHVRHDDLFLVGFARPIIGNVPTISEMQAKDRKSVV